MSSTASIAQVSPVEALILARETLSSTIGRIGLEYDWQADPDHMLVRQNEAFMVIDAAIAGHAPRPETSALDVLRRLDTYLDFETPMTSNEALWTSTDKSEINTVFLDAYAVICAADGRPEDAELARLRNGVAEALAGKGES